MPGVRTLVLRTQGANGKAHQMTHDETRDELARMDGWDAYDASNGIRIWRRGSFFPEEGQRYYKHSPTHPHPPTLDGANAAVPEGWTWTRDGTHWIAWAPGIRAADAIALGNLLGIDAVQTNATKVPDTSNPMDDLYALALACRRAMGERK